ncbi:MAG: hypothetical protein N3E37_02860 [Candidatus Micrarchaeota archaeon]|nr:hypothetical protein [Candidatus Micrarchaeota archaeon]
MNKRLIGLLLLIIAIGVLLISTVTNDITTKEDEKKIILEDLKSKYPGSEIYEIGVSSQDGNGVYSFFVINTKSKICPERLKVEYIYPKNHFVPEVTVITKNCEICVKEICNIAYPEEAVIASHKFNQDVKSFIEKAEQINYYVSKKDNYFQVDWTNEKNQVITVFVYFNGTVELINR